MSGLRRLRATHSLKGRTNMGASGRVGYAVVGLGQFAEHAVLPGFRNSRKAQLVALVSGDERKARRLAKKFGASDCYAYDGLAQCLEHPQVEAVYIATNNSTHAGFTTRAAAAGKHVIRFTKIAGDTACTGSPKVKRPLPVSNASDKLEAVVASNGT